MFKDGKIDGVIIKDLKKYDDARGWLIELFRDDEIEKQVSPVMAYISQTLPGITRGPHEHADQTDYFMFVGPSNFKIYLWDSRKDSKTYQTKTVLVLGENSPGSVIVPPGVVHAYKNIGQVPGTVFNAPNRLFAGKNKQEPVDEIRHEDDENSPYKLD
ncbi:MAG: dTDP-4-dehydrorhamnose 3,5-epimerase family protein [Calditrichaceae bacterium]